MFERNLLEWTVGFTHAIDEEPERFVHATVPGAVQLDWACAEEWDDPHVGDNWRQYLWMEDVWWLYRAPLAFEPPADGERLVFVCKGVDYRFCVRLNGRVLREQEGMFTPFEIDLTGRARPGDVLEVLVWPAPKSRPEPADRCQANQSCKPAVSYGWDFHPRLVPLGIWDETWLEVRPACHLRSAEVFYELSHDLTRVDVFLDAEFSEAGRGRLRWRMRDAAGRQGFKHECEGIAETIMMAGEIEAPALWWPNGQGEPALYTSTVELLDADGQVVQTETARVGFRRVRLVMHPGAWEHPPNDSFPKPRSNPPITLEINGRRIFCKGANWVSPDIFPGRITTERYEELLELARSANMNLLRCWGGAIVQKDAFFELCDELGLMVWQEFPLACNRYDGTPEYLRVLDQESRSIIRRLRAHASVAIWCGGNELFNAWSGMTDQDLALRLLNRNCYDLDPGRPFLMTSPVMGMGHGHYIFRTPTGREVFQLFAEAACTAYTEFGCGGPAWGRILREVIPESELWPPRPGTAWETHHAVAAWAPNSHLVLDVIEHYFGPCETVEQLVERGQILQGEGLKCLFEEARRQKPRASMALNWCFNEPWPAAANMSIVCWPAVPKKAHAEVANACRPVLASAKIPRFAWREGELFDPELWLLNDGPEPIPAGRIEAWLRFGEEEIFLLGWDHAGAAANCNLPGPIVRCVLPRRAADHATLLVRVAGRPEWDSEYLIMYAPREREAGGTRALNQ